MKQLSTTYKVVSNVKKTKQRATSSTDYFNLWNYLIPYGDQSLWTLLPTYQNQVDATNFG
jgi:5-methylcytosine-specific restriction endonuclease McrBC regulatory subunit McrC